MDLLIRFLLGIMLCISFLGATTAIKGTNNQENQKRRRRNNNRRVVNDYYLDEIDFGKQDKAVRNLVSWFIEQGGFIHPSVEIRRWDPKDPSSYFGAMVNGPIEKDELLIKVPGSVKIQLDDSYRTEEYTYVQAVCELAWRLQTEFHLGTESEYAPYLEYIQTLSKHQIPAMWSDVGKYLIGKVQGDLSMMDFAAEDIEGAHMHNWIQDYFGGDECLEDDDDELEEWFVAMATQRGFDVALIPIYDMLNHHNGLVNSITRPSIYDKDGFGVYALEDLQAGDELMFSYHDCPDCKSCADCETSLDYWGTPEMLRDFGFVEPYPQRFYYQDMGPVYLKIDHTPDGFNIENLDGEWPDIEWVKEQIMRLGPLYDQDIYPLRNSLPLHELETIINYHESLLQLFTAYYKAHLAEMGGDDYEGEWADDQYSEYNDDEEEEESEDESEDEDELSSSDQKDETMEKKQDGIDEEEDTDEFSTEL